MFGYSWCATRVLGSQVFGQASMKSCDLGVILFKEYQDLIKLIIDQSMFRVANCFLANNMHFARRTLFFLYSHLCGFLVIWRVGGLVCGRVGHQEEWLIGEIMVVLGDA